MLGYLDERSGGPNDPKENGWDEKLLPIAKIKAQSTRGCFQQHEGAMTKVTRFM